MTFTRIFVLERKFAYAWGGGTSSIFDVHRPRSKLQRHRDSYFVLGHILRLRGSILAWGPQAVIWGGTAPKCPPVAPGPHFTSLQTP